MDVDDEIRALAAEQQSAVSRDQVRCYGGDRWWQLHRVGRGEWRLATSRVLVLNGSPDTDLQRLMIGLLDAGTGMTISHDSAAWLWGLDGFSPSPVHVTAIRNINRRPGIAIQHEPRRLFVNHLTVVEGFPVTSIVRTIFDLAPSQPPARIRRLVHAVLRRSPSSLPVFHRVLAELAVRGKPGIRVMREILSGLPIGSVPAGSGLELRFEEILADAGEPPLLRQVSLGGQEFIGRVDYVDSLDPDLVFEIDSRTYHLLLPEDRERDTRRDESLEHIGKRVVRIPETLLWRDPRAVLNIVRTERAASRRRSGAGTVTPGSRFQHQFMR